MSSTDQDCNQVRTQENMQKFRALQLI